VEITVEITCEVWHVDIRATGKSLVNGGNASAGCAHSVYSLAKGRPAGEKRFRAACLGRENGFDGKIGDSVSGSRFSRSRREDERQNRGEREREIFLSIRSRSKRSRCRGAASAQRLKLTRKTIDKVHRAKCQRSFSRRLARTMRYSFHFRHAALASEHYRVRDRSVASRRVKRSEQKSCHDRMPSNVNARMRRTIRVCGSRSFDASAARNRGSIRQSSSRGRAEEEEHSFRSLGAFTADVRADVLLTSRRATENREMVGEYARLGDPLSKCPV